MLANVCVESHLRDLLEKGFEVAVVKDATAGPRHPTLGDGYKAAVINFGSRQRGADHRGGGGGHALTAWRDRALAAKPVPW